MLILGIECTSSPVSCALYEDGKIKGEYFLNLKITHSQTLLPMVDSLLKLTGISIKDIDAIAVTSGPGSFTGVRIGIGAVKGLATPNHTSCIPVSVLESMAYNLLGCSAIVCAVMDARCNQVYNALFDVEGDKVTRLCDDRALMIDELFEEVNDKYNKPIIIVGDGAELVYGNFSKKNNIYKLAPEHLKYQRASSVCLLASKIREKCYTYADGLLPVYLRLPQAERELRAKQENKGDIKNG